MKHEARTTLVVTAGELHDLITAALTADWVAEKAIRDGKTDTPEPPRVYAERLRPLLRRLQETEAVMAARKGKYPEAFYTWLESKYQFTAYQLGLMDETFQQSLFREWEADFGGKGAST